MANIIDVYNEIATDFSDTRHSVWNGCKDFLNTLDANSTLAEIGCGNGKNLLHRQDLKSTGVDLCEKFVEICKNRGLNVVHGDIRNIPLENNSFDNTMSIAVIHHLDKRLDRIKAIEELIRITKINGRILISVWAFEQSIDSKRKFITQDEMVPFQKKNGKKFYRYYHLYKIGELENEIAEIKNVKIEKSYNENDNYILIISKLANTHMV